MRYSKGKWIASSKDTWWVGKTLNKIQLAYITKLYDCLKSSKSCGVPMKYVKEQAEIQGIENPCSDEVDIDKAHDLRMKDLEELIWVFSDNEPDISNYNFSYDFGNDVPNGLKCSNPEECERYSKDLKEYEERKHRGYELFGKIYHILDW